MDPIQDQDQRRCRDLMKGKGELDSASRGVVAGVAKDSGGGLRPWSDYKSTPADEVAKHRAPGQLLGLGT